MSAGWAHLARAAGKGTWLAVVLLCFVILSAAAAYTRFPICDEAFYANPGHNLMVTGSTGTSVLETAGRYLTRLDQRTYWEMPFFLLFQSIWYRIAGFSIPSLRSISLGFAVLGIVSWYVIVWEWTASRRVAGLSIALLSLDYFYQSVAVVGRSDATAFGLASAALAVFLVLRRTSPKLAFLGSHALAVLSGLTHPVGGLIALGALLLVQTDDLKKRFRWTYVACSAVPYLIGALLWGAYILQDPQAFRDQFLGNSAGRLWPFLHPLRALGLEFSGHYWAAFGGTDSQLLRKVRLLVLAFYGWGVLATWRAGSIRSIPSTSNLRRMVVLVACVLLFFEGAKQSTYVIYMMPCFAAAGALLLADLWKSRVSFITLPLTGLLLLIQLTFSVYNIYSDPYHRRFVPAVDYLLKQSQGRLILGPAELGLEVPNVVEDKNFGRLSGKTPAFIVLAAYSGDSHDLRGACGGDESCSIRLARLLTDEYSLVYKGEPFEIFRRILQ